MAGVENQVPTKNRASRKRPNQSAEGNPMMKKRVVLGELTNISPNVSGLTQNSGMEKTRREKPKPVSDKIGNKTNFDLVVSRGSDEPQKIGYASSIFQHLHSLEVEAKRRPLSNYIEKVQEDINPAMRTILVDWLVEVAEEYKLVSDTLYLTINYIDRYLSAHKLIRNKLQLLGVSCMLVASIFTRAAQEKPMFANLQFEFLCYYLAELSLLDYGCVRYIPSILAASAIFLARSTIQPKFHPWTLALQQHTCYKPYELKECVLRLQNLQLRSETSARAVRQKYMDHKKSCQLDLKSARRMGNQFSA
ncbi:hypothetical protein DH2020_006568 [Rehmannia glutinosa]|uniref:B-like cyclin n=1 Tax=Rehmannia glutinosa TaxID=99300 RepID=A0ABR0XJ92_REHGL